MLRYYHMWTYKLLLFFDWSNLNLNVLNYQPLFHVTRAKMAFLHRPEVNVASSSLMGFYVVKWLSRYQNVASHGMSYLPTLVCETHADKLPIS